MAFSYQNYTGNNATTTFSIPFTYTDTSEISVTVDGVAETGLAFPSSSEVTLTSAPASGTLVQVRRTTSLTERAVDFASGSVLTEEDLDNSSIQTFHASQEANDRANDAIAFDADGKWDAQNKVIKNLATPTDANDATNKSYVDTSANNAASSAAAALVSQNASAASATASANSATASAGSATTSANKASNSADSATASAASAATATTQAALATSNGAVQVALATTQADNAASSATTAATQATLATTNGAAQVALATTQANLATTNGAAQVALATTQANNAASSASTAATQATASASSASTSATQATNSANSATASANSATSASSAQTAAESARDATLAAYDNFDDRYLGAKSSSPTVDNDGNALIAGSLFFDTTNEAMKIYTGSAWVAAYVTGADFIPTSGGGITGDLAFGDNNKAIFGAGNDLQIYHDSSASYIVDSGTGSLNIHGTNLNLRDADGNTYIDMSDNGTGGTVRIRHNTAVKLTTKTDGVLITGELQADSLDINGSADIAGNLSVDGGTIKLDGNHPTGSANVALGNTALDSLSGGGYNVAIGTQALTATTSGDANVGVGYGALDANTTASFNVGVGYDALGLNSTGTANVAVGGQALDANTTASNNTAVGHASLGANTTGAQNTAVGKSAGAAITTAVNNVLMGYQAGDAITTGNNNVAVGTTALSATIGGGNNTAIGHAALLANTTGAANNAIGYNSQGAVTTGSGNVSVGVSALGLNTTGGQNVAIGNSALYKTTSAGNTGVGNEAGYYVTSGANNTVLGAYALKGTADSTASNNTAIGYTALTANTTGTGVTAVGMQSGRANTTGENNTFLGINAGYSNTTAGDNTAVGSDALFANTTATGNTAVGRQSQKFGTTGGSNVSVGLNTLYTNTTGVNNTAIGRDALFNANVSSANTAVGQSAGSAITSGDNNTIIGRFNGNQGGLDIRTTNNNIVLSDGAGNPKVFVDSSGNFNMKGIYNLTTTEAPNVYIASSGYMYRSTASAGNSPAFCASRNADQTSNINTVTKVDFNAAIYNSGGGFANGRFTPGVAGVYYIYAQVNNNNLYNQAALNIYIRRNGTNVAQGHVAGNNSTSNRDYTINCAIVIGAGASDYFEVFASQELGNGQMIASVRSMFLGFKVG